jgi:hypothetical protein
MVIGYSNIHVTDHSSDINSGSMYANAPHNTGWYCHPHCTYDARLKVLWNADPSSRVLQSPAARAPIPRQPTSKGGSQNLSLHTPPPLQPVQNGCASTLGRRGGCSMVPKDPKDHRIRPLVSMPLRGSPAISKHNKGMYLSLPSVFCLWR